MPPLPVGVLDMRAIQQAEWDAYSTTPEYKAAQARQAAEDAAAEVEAARKAAAVEARNLADVAALLAAEKGATLAREADAQKAINAALGPAGPQRPGETVAEYNARRSRATWSDAEREAHNAATANPVSAADLAIRTMLEGGAHEGYTWDELTSSWRRADSIRSMAPQTIPTGTIFTQLTPWGEVYLGQGGKVLGGAADAVSRWDGSLAPQNLPSSSENGATGGAVKWTGKMIPTVGPLPPLMVDPAPVTIPGIQLNIGNDRTPWLITAAVAALIVFSG